MGAKRLIRISALLIGGFALLSIFISIFQINHSLSTMLNMTPEEAAQVEVMFRQMGMDMDQVYGMLRLVVYGILAVTTTLSAMKVIVSLLLILKPERSNGFYLAWGIVFLTLGILGLGVGMNLLGLCNLMAGILGPILLLVSGIKMKHQTAPVS